MPKARQTLESWESVDRALQEIGEYEIALSIIEAERKIEETEAAAKAAERQAPILEQKAALEKLVENWAVSAKSDMDGKTKKLNFGTVGFRESTFIEIPAGQDDVILKNLRRLNMEDCIKTKESISKTALGRYSDAEIAKAGAARRCEDRFFLKVGVK